MSFRRWSPTLGAILVASLVVACSSSGAATQINETVEGFYQALVVDPPRAYTYLSEDCQQDLPFLDFAMQTLVVVQLLGESQPEIENLRVLRGDDDTVDAQFDIVVHVDGQTVPIVRGEDSITPSFVREGGRWRFASCEDFGFDVDATDQASNGTDDAPQATESPLTDAVAAEANDDPDLAGEYIDLPAIYGGDYSTRDGPHTASHIHQEIDYAGDGNSIPPAGGPHWGNGACGSSPSDSPPFCGPVPWGIHRTEWDAESLVHNMEHGGAIVWYNTTDRDVVDDLEDLVADRLERGDLIVMAPYLDMEGGHIAVTSWSRIDMFPVEDYNRDRINTFLDDHVRRFNPEEF